ncbi:DUF309 domain-containing protein [Neobacillus notoginsengisoli]|uniref:DUF309 domain-containing protein n=1 Tax=Neobacillus notoginsengisoli TaxID=1578198 RepID=A0A417YYM2_9BACI|nr:DUF309 domain-containing protein [Neobacillus notoginsengisoli]RHW42627.1 DUF309 domain-containing protein [Neobacillus notoginsengisoli]
MEFYPPEYYEFFICFNEGDYYTCHDLLEDMWMEEKGNLFFKGLLQMSVALYHYSYGNIKGARVMMQTANDYLQGYRPKHWGLDLEKVITYIEACQALIPSSIDRVTYEEVDNLPELPRLFLYLEE